jgi:hypothetical protein
VRVRPPAVRRRINFGSKRAAVAAFAAAVAVTACGRQVTPNPAGIGPGGAPEGFMSAFLDVAAPFNFSQYQYWIVFNVSGNGLTPGVLPANNNWAAYSAAIEVTGTGGSTSARAVQFVKSTTNPHAVPAFETIPSVPGQSLIYIYNSNGSQTEFNVIFKRSLFRGIANDPQTLAANWTFNSFSTQANTNNNLVFVDSMGQGGNVLPDYTSPVLPTYQCFDTQPLFARYTGNQIPAAAQIVSTDIANNPSPSPSSAPCTGEDDVKRAVR